MERLARRAPRLRAPLFHAFAAACCFPEIVAAGPVRAARALARLRRLTAGGMTSPAEAVLRRLEIMAAFDVEERLAEIACPVLVVSGSRGLDGLVPRASQSALVSRIRGAEHAVVRGSGHLGVLIHPERVSAVVEEFLLRRWTGDAPSL